MAKKAEAKRNGAYQLALSKAAKAAKLAGLQEEETRPDGSEN